MKRKSIETTSVWKNISLAKPENLVKALDAPRISSRVLSAGGGLSYSYSAMDISDETILLLGKAAEELELIEQFRELAGGEVMNIGENRLVLHHALRGTPTGPVLVGGKDYSSFYADEAKRFYAFAEAIRSGAIRGSTGLRFKHVVQIGIGGSDLGPRALYLALEQWARERGLLQLKASFISNVDPDDANAILAGIDPETTLFVLVSKSGTTQETLANEMLVRTIIERTAGVKADGHMVAVTSETSPLAHNPRYLDSFYIDDFIGGRYSATSAVGGVILSVSLGPDTFASLLKGAAEADILAFNKDINKNAAMMDAMLGLVERCVYGRPASAVLPYTQALSRFPAHLQQLDMESNGKVADRDGKPCAIPTGPVIFGEPGTNGQHSFYQLLHQGSDTIPIQFIGFGENQSSYDPVFEGSTGRKKLNANLVAQIAAFALGHPDKDPNKAFSGQRPSSLLFGRRLDPAALGALLAHYENKVMFQGFAWNLNSFDQEGVQLGKLLTKRVLAEGGPADPVLAAFSRLLESQ